MTLVVLVLPTSTYATVTIGIEGSIMRVDEETYRIRFTAVLDKTPPPPPWEPPPGTTFGILGFWSSSFVLAGAFGMPRTIEISDPFIFIGCSSSGGRRGRAVSGTYVWE
jgi:hypothetical protein